jgi:16S rRNA processing protein RimM
MVASESGGEKGPAGSLPPDLIELGAVRGAYGIKGWIRVVPYAAEGGVLLAVSDWWLTRSGDSGKQVAVDQRRRHGAAILAKLPGFETKEAADALKGTTVAVARSAFPPLEPGEHYVTDLLGSRVVNRAGEVLGEVVGLRDSQAAGEARQWLEVADQAEIRLIPLIESYVDEVDAAGRVIRVDWQRDW